MSKIKIIFLIPLFFIQSPSFAEIKNFNINQQAFSILIPEGWTSAENFAGTPLALFGPEVKTGPRSVVLLAPTGATDTKNILNAKDFKKNAKEYKTGREEWLKGILGESIMFDSFVESKWEGIEAAYIFGYRYSLPSGHFYEKMSYILCSGKKVFYVKALIPEDFDPYFNKKLSSSDKNDHVSIFEKLLKSIRCEK